VGGGIPKEATRIHLEVKQMRDNVTSASCDAIVTIVPSNARRTDG